MHHSDGDEDAEDDDGQISNPGQIDSGINCSNKAILDILMKG